MYWSLPAGSVAVETVWAGDSDVDPIVGHRSDPVLGADVVFTVVDDECTVVVQGPLTTRRTYRHRPNAQYIGLRFRPGASEATAGGDLWRLRDDAAPAVDLGWPDLTDLAERLLACSTLEARAELVRSELAAGSRGHPAPDAIVTEVLRRFARDSGPLRVAGIADELGLSERQLQRCFRHHLGLSPKQAARVVRIERLLRLLDGAPATELASVAGRAGFFDQAHMTNDVRRVLGTTPSRLRAEIAQRNAGRASR